MKKRKKIVLFEYLHSGNYSQSFHNLLKTTIEKRKDKKTKKNLSININNLIF